MQERVEAFLTEIEEQEVVDAIRIAEKNTSGEIRVHIENTSNGNVNARALEVFSLLKMHNTRLQNGVLIYVSVQERAFAIYGDKGINDIVSNSFWDETIQVIQSHFIQGRFKQGLIDGILKAGLALQKHFPWDHTDENELPNTISKG